MKEILNNFIKKYDKLLPFFIFLLFFTIFNLNAQYTGSNDTTPAVLLPLSIINERNLNFNEFIENKSDLSYWYANVDGKIISFFPIFTGILNVPVFIVAKIINLDLMDNVLSLAKTTASILSALSVLIMYLIFLKILNSRLTSFLFSFIFGIGTAILPVASQGLWQHGPVVLFLSLAIYFLISEKNKYWSGLFLGLVVLTRPINLIMVLPIILYIFWHERKIFQKTFLLFCFPVFLLLIYSQIYWKNIFMLGQGNTPGAFTNNFFIGLAGLIVSPGRGILFYSPFLVFGLVALFPVFFNKKISVLYKYLAMSGILTLFIYAKWYCWYGGSGFFGYRFLIDILPILMIFTVLLWKNSNDNKIKLAIIVLSIISIYIQIIGYAYFAKVDDKYDGEINRNSDIAWQWHRSELVLTQRMFLKDLGIKK